MNIAGYNKQEIAAMTIAGWLTSKEANAIESLRKDTRDDRETLEKLKAQETITRSDKVKIIAYTGKIFAYSHLFNRICHVVFGAFKLLAVLFDTLSALITIPAFALTFFLNKRLYKVTSESLKSCQLLLPRLFRSTVEFINPNAFFISDKDEVSVLEKPRSRYFIKITDFFKDTAKNFKSDQYLVKERKIESSFARLLTRNIVPRLCYLAKGMVSIVSRIMDVACGIFIACYGILISISNVELDEDQRTLLLSAYEALQIVGIVRDVFVTIAKVINPWINDYADDKKINSEEPAISPLLNTDPQQALVQP